MNYFINWKGVIKPVARSETHALETKSSLNTKEIVLNIADCKVYPQAQVICVSTHLLCDRIAEILQILLFRKEGKTLHQPVIKSVMAKLKTNVLYGFVSIDLF